ncbi:MAG: hypothetical protein J6S82_00760, partial [Bacteroidales bacterium]|nr:hypothetical protein [Bacteroidales bacterium]
STRLFVKIKVKMQSLHGMSGAVPAYSTKTLALSSLCILYISFATFMVSPLSFHWCVMEHNVSDLEAVEE